MKKFIFTILVILGFSFASYSQAPVYVTDAYGIERVVDYGYTYVYVEVDGEWMKTRLYSTMCPHCGHYFDCWHRHHKYTSYTIPAYATVGLYWYFTRPCLSPVLYYRHYPVHSRYAYPVYVDYYRVHHRYPSACVHHSKPAPHNNYYHRPAQKPMPKAESNRTVAPRGTVNTRSAAPAKSMQQANVSRPAPQQSVRVSSSSRSNSYSTRPQSSSSVTKSSSPSYRPASSSTRTSSVRTSSTSTRTSSPRSTVNTRK